MRFPILALLGAGLLAASVSAQAALPVKPDLTVAADGSGDFTTVQAAVASVPKGNHERVIILVKDGVYREKVRIDAADVTLIGQSRAGTRIEFPQGAVEFRRHPDKLGTAVVNINGDDCVLQNLTVQNTQNVIGVHAFAIYGRGDRTVITDANVWSQGNDTLSLWRTSDGMFSEDAGAHASPNGRYYHARLDVCGSVDFICPRGWCYMVDSRIDEVNPRNDAAIWHDGSRDRNMKFVLKDCRFDGVPNWRLARHHHDAQFFLIGCVFAADMSNRAPSRVIYPLDGGTPSADDLRQNREHDPTNRWGERLYFWNSHRDGGDYPWITQNLASAAGSPKPEQVTARWTFDGAWDPENSAGPTVSRIETRDGQLALIFSENVTVKGHPRLALRAGGFAHYASGSGSDTLCFAAPAGAQGPGWLDLGAGTIIATEASAGVRVARLAVP